MMEKFDSTIIRKKKKFLTLKRKEALTGWAFVAPALIGFLIFTAFSMIYSLYMSFTNYSIIGDYKWVGMNNYIEAFTADPFFWQYLLNTVIYVVLLVPTVLVISLFFAILLNKKVKGWTPFYRACLFLPCIVSTVAVSLVWKWIFADNIGMLSTILQSLGVQNPPKWLSSKEMAKVSIVIMRIWQMSGYYMVMFLTGLQTIPDSLYEASKIDGATKWEQLLHITVPMLRPTTFAITILLVLEAFNIFEVVLVMTEGAMSTSSLLYYIYELAFKTQKMGYASAISWIMFIIVMSFTVIRMTAKKDEVY